SDAPSGQGPKILRFSTKQPDAYSIGEEDHRPLKAAVGGTVKRVRARGFTVIELSIVLIIIAILSAIALVAIRGTVLTSRTAAEKQVCIALRQGVEQFKQQFNFLPPLIDDFDVNGPYEVAGEVGQPLQQIGTAGAKTQDQYLRMPAPDRK